MVLRRFWVPFGIIFVTFWWSLALVKTVSPLARELCFECFEASETGLFPASLFTTIFGTISVTLGGLLASPGAPIGTTLGTIGRLFRSVIFIRFWVPKRSILGTPCKGGKGNQ